MGSIDVTTSGDHNAGWNGASAPESAASNQGYRITELPFGTKRRIKIIVMGSGISGLNWFKRSEEQLEDVEIVCYEKNNDIGGTVCNQTNILLCQSSEAFTFAPWLTRPH